MIPEDEITKIREELDNCKRPLFFFHDDADGLCSFLLFYRYKIEGKGIVVKTHPGMDSRFAKKVEEYGPDKVFILDVPVVDQEFFDKVAELNVPCFWIDHHNPAPVQHAVTFNPRKHDPDDDTCITRVCYEVVKRDIWIAMVGAIGDWQKPDYWNDFIEEYPDLLDKSIKEQKDALFASRLGELVKVFSFVLKGATSEVIKCMKVLTRIESPYEILDQKTPKGRFIHKRYEMINRYYDELLSKGLEKVTKKMMVVFIYKGEKYSFSSELANELLYKYPSKIIIVGREKAGEIKFSIRATDKLIPPALEKALNDVEGYGGGHEHACGACVKADDAKKFLEELEKAL
ncbi:MAG: DHH family phosphoesterase [Candidatus Woesearchaeota archaeon]